MPKPIAALARRNFPTACRTRAHFTRDSIPLTSQRRQPQPAAAHRREPVHPAQRHRLSHPRRRQVPLQPRHGPDRSPVDPGHRQRKGRRPAGPPDGHRHQRHPLAQAALDAGAARRRLVIVVELLGVRSLTFAVGAYLSIATTLAIFVGGVMRWMVDRAVAKAGGSAAETESEDLPRHPLCLRPHRRRRHRRSAGRRPQALRSRHRQ